jgi:uncharacterized membrane protein
VSALRHDLRSTTVDHLPARRGIVATSLLGMASMAAVSLFQIGIIRHLPEPSLPGFDADKVNSSKTAYALGIPDGPLALLDFALNVPLAVLGGAMRARRWPWIPLLAAGKAGIAAAISAWYFYQMPARERAWCLYCIVGALASAGVFVLTLPEAREALSAARAAGQTGGLPGSRMR